jgi:hypothetical protein
VKRLLKIATLEVRVWFYLTEAAIADFVARVAR